MKLSSRDDKLSGLGLVGPADVHASVMAPRVPNHQVGCEDDHISGHWLPICTETDKKKEKEVSQGSLESDGRRLTFSCLRTAAQMEEATQQKKKNKLCLRSPSS